MNKVITINLNGNAYQLEEPGYEKLHDYLTQATNRLADNPDKEEIIADFEQAIADKCNKYLNVTKTVVTSKEIDAILQAMGPVEDAKEDQDGAPDAAAQAQPAPKRLFKIRQGAVIEGVCNGLAAYFDTDPTIVRVVFIVLTILTGGGWIAAYILMAIFVPEAKTREDIAKAQGKEFNAQTLLANAHDRYEYWKEFGKKQKAMWEEDKSKTYQKKDRGEKAAAKAAVAAENPYEWTPGKGGRFGRAVAGIIGAIGVIALTGLGIVWIIALVKIFTTGTLLGYFGTAPVWLIALLASCIFYLIFIPLQGVTGCFLRYSSGRSMPPSLWGKVFAWLLWFGAAAGFVTVLSYSTPMRDGFEQIRHDYDQSHHIGR